MPLAARARPVLVTLFMASPFTQRAVARKIIIIIKSNPIPAGKKREDARGTTLSRGGQKRPRQKLTLTCRALHCLHPFLLFLWPKRGICRPANGRTDQGGGDGRERQCVGFARMWPVSSIRLVGNLGPSWNANPRWFCAARTVGRMPGRARPARLRWALRMRTRGISRALCADPVPSLFFFRRWPPWSEGPTNFKM